MSDLKEQLANQLHEAQGKYTYFLLAAAASGIALAVQQTAGQHIAWQHAILCATVILWAGSFFAGCQNRHFFNSTLVANIVLLQLQDGSHPESPTHPEAKAAACDGVRIAAEKNSTSGNTWGQWQFRLLVYGALGFVLWHVTCMVFPIPNHGHNADSRLPDRQVRACSKIECAVVVSL